MAKMSALEAAMENANYKPRKGDRVTVRLEGKENPAVITKVTAAKVGVLLDDGRNGTMPSYAVTTGQIKPSSLPLPAGMKQVDFKKGDRVELDYKGKVIYGVVKKGGTRVQVIADGGKEQFGVDPRNLRPSDVPLPKDPPHAMDAWGLKGYKANEAFSEETLMFQSEITLNGKAVISAKNDGRGGCNMYYPLEGGYATVEKFLESAKQWLRDHGMPEDDIYEPGDNWINWKANEQPYGVTAKAMVEADIARWKELRGERDESTAPGMK